MILIDKKQTKNGETRFIIEFLVMFKAAEKWGMIWEKQWDVEIQTVFFP